MSSKSKQTNVIVDLALTNMSTLSALVKALPVFAATTVLAAVNYPPIPADLTTPVQQRLAIDGPNSMSVGWNTFKQLAQPCVSYGLSSTQLLNDSCSTSSVTYPSSRTWSNAVTITGLEPSTVYYCKLLHLQIVKINRLTSPGA